jgi:hypothetical protein
MKISNNRSSFLIALLAGLSAPAFATVQLVSVTPSAKSPQAIGKIITYSATATDSSAGPLTFQFQVAAPGGKFQVIEDYNVGTLNSGTWTSQPFVWAPTSCAEVPLTNGVDALTCHEIEGVYQVQVNVKDFNSGQTATKTVKFEMTPLATGSTPVVTATANPLVALFSSPLCATGSQMRVSFQEQSKSKPATVTNWVACNGSTTMNFEIAGMYPSTAYEMFAQTETGTKITNGPSASFTTGALPTGISFPTAKQIVKPGPQTDTALPVLLFDPHQFGGGPTYPDFATDLAGNIIWYYATNPAQNLILGRPLANGTMLTIQNEAAWAPAGSKLQILEQIDLAGNIIRQTNAGIIQQELVAMGSVDGGPCSAIPSPAPVGSGCLDNFHHEAIQTLPNGDTAFLAAIEKIFPPGTMGDTSGLPVDVVGDMVIVLNSDWQVIFYDDAFLHDTGPTQWDITRPPVLGETCSKNEDGCALMFLLGPGISPLGVDWLHSNSLYYWPMDQEGVAGQIIWSSRNQDWVVKMDYQNGTGTGNLLWRMGNGGNFTIVSNDPWPWFSGQHDVSFQNNGTGSLTCFDNGNTRISPPPLGLGSPGCEPSDCNSRGMALTVDESSMTVTPVLSTDLGVYSISGGIADLQADGNYFFGAVDVVVNINEEASYGIEILPTAGTTVGTTVFNLQDTEGYREWQMTSLYLPPFT